uniref:ATP synthase F0 subunit 8 n=1 Tax=Panthalis oerstedi TaxID=318815 RepID=A0A343W6D2_9ANNE|nr:ATP synthase F0 subunit 8 [Panthalis oerstedi]
MPHLSPLNWLLAPLIFFLLLASFSSILWWSQAPSCPLLSDALATPNKTHWKW